jgi:hypothetical protein
MNSNSKLIKVSSEVHDFLSWCKDITNSSSYDETIKKLSESMQKEASKIHFWWSDYKSPILEDKHRGQAHTE